MQCEIQPQSEPVICRYNAYDYKKQGRGGGKALPCCSSFPYILLAGSRASPSLSCPQRCSSAPVRGVCCRACTLWRGEQLPMPHVPMHVSYASWPQRNSCTQRHQHTACVNAHTICQHIRLYGREYVGATAIHIQKCQAYAAILCLSGTAVLAAVTITAHFLSYVGSGLINIWMGDT